MTPSTNGVSLFFYKIVIILDDMNYQQILENIYNEIQPYAKEDKQADILLSHLDNPEDDFCVLCVPYRVMTASTTMLRL